MLLNEKFVHPVLSEPNTKNTENCSGEIVAIFIMNRATQENGKLMPQSPNASIVCRLQIIKHNGLGGFGVVLGVYWLEMR